MKSFNLIFIGIIAWNISLQAYAQESIYKTDGSVIEAEIESIDGNTISYKTTKKSLKAPAVKVDQTSLIVFENGHYLTFPNPKYSLESIRSKKNLPNDVILTKYVDVLEGSIINITSDKIEFFNSKSNSQSSVKLDEVLMVIYKNGEHKLFKKAPEIRTFLEHMQPEILATLDKVPESSMASAIAPATGRPAHLSGNESSQPATVAPIGSTVATTQEVVPVVQPVVVATSNQPVQAVQPVQVVQQIQPTQPVQPVQVVQQVQPTQPVQPVQVVQQVQPTQPVQPVQVVQPAQPVQPVQQEQSFQQVQATTQPQSYQPPLATSRPGELNNIDFDEFSDKALQKIDDFTNYISIIASKETYPESANQAIELAIELFVSEDVQVEVSTTGFSASVKRKIRDYLNRLKLLKYDRVDIQWADINYVSNFRKAPDGNYYGTVSVKQTFRGYKDNQVVYSDVTTKDVEVVIKGMEKSIQGQLTMVWDVLLSDIGVVDTK
jgi:hypothetical protein